MKIQSTTRETLRSSNRCASPKDSGINYWSILRNKYIVGLRFLFLLTNLYLFSYIKMMYNLYKTKFKVNWITSIKFVCLLRPQTPFAISNVFLFFSSTCLDFKKISPHRIHLVSEIKFTHSGGRRCWIITNKYIMDEQCIVCFK